MKSKKRTKLITLGIIFALMFTTALGLNFNNFQKAQGAGQGSLRFYQVEAGEDFAIGLTYEGELYGWSLTKTDNSTTLNADNTLTDGANAVDETSFSKTLGQYYPQYPIKINVNFRQDGTDTIADNNAVAGSDDTKIIKIAATRTTAALLTKSGVVYTWGYDKADEGLESNSGQGGVNVAQKGLLFRNLSNSKFGNVENENDKYEANNTFYEPYPINQNSYRMHIGVVTRLPVNEEGTVNATNNFDSKITDIIAGTDNYVYQTSSFFGSWGNSSYGQLRAAVANANDKLANADFTKSYSDTKVKDFGPISGTSVGMPVSYTNIYAGAGYIVGGNDSGAINIKGKNFYIPAGQQTYSYSITPETLEPNNDLATLNLLSISNSNTTYYDGSNDVTFKTFMGISSSPSGTPTSTPSNNWMKIESALATTFTQINGASSVSGKTQAVFTNIGSTDAISSNVDNVALGTSFGYYVGTDKNVYFWGDNSNNQAGGYLANGHVNTATQIAGITNAKQIVAGKMPLGANHTGSAGTSGQLFKTSYSSTTVGGTGFTNKGTVNFSGANVTIDFDDRYSDFDSLNGFISAALTKATGSASVVTAWNHIIGSTQAVKFYNTTSTEVQFSEASEIIKLVSGYGNNLFALTKLGKIYHIKFNSDSGEFEGKLINNFYNAEGTQIEAFKKGSVSVEWKDGYQSGGTTQVLVRPTYGTVETASGLDKRTDITSGLSSQHFATSGKFISSNNTGDAFRLMVDTGYASGTEIKNDFALDVNSSNYAIRFYLGGTQLTKEAAAKYINVDYEYSYTANAANDYNLADDLRLKLTPIRSTKGQTLTMTFYVAQFDSAENFKNPTVNPKSVFYAYHPMTLNFKIGNTSSVVVEDVDRLAQQGVFGNNSPIPLLDPNNEDAKNYSLALMNVSGGLDVIAKRIADLSIGEKDSTTILESFNASIVDSGFPSSSKISEGALDYVYGSAANAERYYNNKYLYLASDKDGDLITFADANSVTKSSDKKNNYKISDAYAILDLDPYLGNDTEALRKFKEFFAFDSEGEFNQILSIFSNEYGFYGVSFDETTKKLTLKYDIVEIEAIESTNTVTYADGRVGSPVFTKSIDVTVKSDKFSVNLVEVGQTANHILPSAGYFPVHVQSSLRVKESQTPGAEVYGKNDSALNTFDYLGNGSKIWNVRVGQDKDLTVSISQFFNDTANIEFAYEGASTTEAFKKFNDKFTGPIYDMNLSKTEIKFTPKSTGRLIFTVEARRYDMSSGSQGTKFTESGGIDAEVIYIRFILNSEEAEFKAKDGRTEADYVINSNWTLDITSRFSIADLSFVKILDKVEILDTAAVASDQIIKVSVDNTNKTLNFTAVKSGVVKVRYYVQRYSVILTDTITIVVEGVSELPSIYSIATVENIYLDNIKTTLKALNPLSKLNEDSIGFKGLVVDKTSDPNAPEGIYYQIKNSSGEWVTVPKDDVSTVLPFIKLVELRAGYTGDFLRIELGEVSGNVIQTETRVVLKFIKDSYKFDAAIRVSPANKFLQTKDEHGNDKPFVFTIVYGKDFEGQTEDLRLPSRDNQNNAVTLPLSYLIDMLPASELYLFDGAEIGIIDGSQGFDDYVKVGTTTTSLGAPALVLTPVYPTKELTDEAVLISIAVNTNAASYLFSFYVRITNITVELTQAEYTKIFLVAALIVFLVLFVLFIIRMGIYWRRKAQQRRIIRKNQMLIKMRDKIHNKTAAAPREQLVRTKMKMEDPKYAKMFNTMRETKEEETGITLENSSVAKKAEKKTKVTEEAGKKSKKKTTGGKRSMEELEQLKAELEAKKVAFAQMQVNGVPPIMNIDSDGLGMDQSIINTPVFESPDGYRADLSREDVENQIKAKIAEDSFLEFETIEPDDDSGLV